MQDSVFEKKIWSVAGGKGGTGKSVITANIGIGLSLLGFRVIIIDGDLGGPNLHNYLNLKKPTYTINDFIINKISSLEDIVLETPIENLEIISGGTELLGVANLPYQKKQKIIRHINNLTADYILVDLGAGTTFNTLDFFNLSNKGIIVSNPEPNAKYDAYYFLKNAIFRKINNEFKKNKSMKAIINKFLKEHNNVIVEIPKFLNFLKSESDETNTLIENFLSSYKPKLLMNKIRNKDQIREGHWFVNLVKSFLLIDMEYAGHIVFDERVVHSSESIIPFIFKYPKCDATKNIYQVITTLHNNNSHSSLKSFRSFKQELKKENKKWAL